MKNDPAASSRVTDPAERVLDREVLALRLRERPVGRLVLANGLFDLVHVGHARYLIDARAAGDALVVALNDDDSARKIKGPERPIVPLAERALLIAALDCVDYVTWFPETSVAHTIRLLRPKIHAKGTDYSPERLPEDEQKAHAELGIEVAIVGDPKTHATRDIIGQILSSEDA